VQPQVTVNQRVVLTQTAPIAELAVVTKEELVTLGFNEHLEVLSLQIPLTEKKLTAEATYRIKAGFDLRNLSPSKSIRPPMRCAPPCLTPKSLSVEQVGDLTLPRRGRHAQPHHRRRAAANPEQPQRGRA
jgi:hypothetical protein